MPMPVIGLQMSPLPCCSEANMVELSVRGGGAVACSAAVKLCGWQSVGTVHE